jgi:hypothetical protein
MNPVIAEASRCPKCDTKLNHFANVDYCPNCGQAGVGFHGDRCPNGCAGPIVNIPGAGRRCQQCSAQW